MEFNINAVSFIDTIDNEQQQRILYNTFSGRSGTMYIVDGFKSQNDTCIQILGSPNLKGREKYNVKLDNNNNRFKCTCKDFVYRSKRFGIVCKHIIFLLCKVAKIFDKQFFDTKCLKEDDAKAYKDLFSNSAIWKDRTVSVKDINQEFNQISKPFVKTELCPICYECYGDVQCISCPDCYNYVHEKCMSVWLEERTDCVFCRSHVFQDYFL